MDRTFREALADQLGASIVEARGIGGGSINQAWGVGLADGRKVFVKANAAAPATMFETERRGLAFLVAGLQGRGQAELRIPRVLAIDERKGAERARYLVLELLEPGPPAADFDERLGRGLAALHQSGAELDWGLDHDNFIGSVPQPNASAADWPSFYRERRLRPMLERAGARGLVDAGLRRRFDRLFDRLAQLCGEPEPPARLHGDLWSGNLHRDSQGRPALIDPAVYAGHREMDLAMMRLFGGFSRRTFAAYGEAWPLAPGAEERVDLYQLYPLLVHVVLFGASYLGSLDSALRRLV